nr:GntR family transcriptional regulator [Planococcus glaciei]
MTIKSDHRALYLQVIDRMKQDIAAGLYKEKEKLPSEFELAKTLGSQPRDFERSAAVVGRG